MQTDIDPAPESLFRPVKRRRFLRRRVENEPEDNLEDDIQTTEQENDSNQPSHPPRPSQDADATAASAASIARVRRPLRSRKVGVEFSNSPRPGAGQAQPAAEVATTEDGEDLKIQAKCDRFTAHTGQKVDVDKHMYCPFNLFL